MISVNEAKEIIRNTIAPLSPIVLPLSDAVGYILAEDVFSPIDFPPFNQSSVDGYAMAFKDAGERLIIKGEAAAGFDEVIALDPNHAMRIFTGAAVPANADTIVMQEKVVVENGCLLVQDKQLQKGLNFRPQGRDIQKGMIALNKHNFLSAGAIGFLAALGIAKLKVIQKPSIGIIITGNELQQPGNSLQYGQVYESNSFALKAALFHMHFTDVKISRVKDDLPLLTNELHHALNSNDMVLVCGGVSVGDYDFVIQAANNCGVKQLFHTVKQRPGKPLYFGKKENTIVFGLPGNPSSVLTCFYEYVAIALELLMNKRNAIQSARLPLEGNYKKQAGLTFFLKGWYDENKVMPLDAQESYRLRSFAKANCLIQLEENLEEYKTGDLVEVHRLPN